MTVTTWSKLVLTCLYGKARPSGRCTRKRVGKGWGPETVAVCMAERFSCIWHLDECFAFEYPLCGGLVQEANARWYSCPQGSLFAPLLKKLEDDCWGEGKMGW